MTPRAPRLLTLAALAAATTLGACASGPREQAASGGDRGGIGLFGRGEKSKEAEAQIGVNSFLWQATLDTLSFMPLASADPYGGVVTTDWYANPERPNERFKATVFILDTRLRADGIKVSINRETLTVNGWTTAETNPDTTLQIENAILTKARQLRLSTIDG